MFRMPFVELVLMVLIFSKDNYNQAEMFQTLLLKIKIKNSYYFLKIFI